MVPEQMRYAQTHEWCRLDGEFLVIGVTENAIRPLGDLIYVELPENDDDVLIEVPFGEIEGSRGSKDLTSPVDGRVAEVNSRIVLNPEILNKDPYGDGWLVKLKAEGPISLDNLLSASDYEDFVRKRKAK